MLDDHEDEVHEKECAYNFGDGDLKDNGLISAATSWA